jgi:hypothetical protein
VIKPLAQGTGLTGVLIPLKPLVMKNHLFVALLFAGACAFAQTPPKDQSSVGWKQRKEKMESMKIAFITQKLSLTPGEAEKFWPVYNEFTKKNDALRKEQMDQHRGKKMDLDSMSEKDASELIDKHIAFQEQQTALLKEYTPKFKAVLPVKKVALLFQAEKEFRMLQHQKMMQRKKNEHRSRLHGKHQPPPEKDGQGK